MLGSTKDICTFYYGRGHVQPWTVWGYTFDEKNHENVKDILLEDC